MKFAFQTHHLSLTLYILGQNSIVIVSGANLLLETTDLEKAEEIIRKSHVVTCQLEIRQNTVLKALELARKHSGNWRNTFVFFNPIHS